MVRSSGRRPPTAVLRAGLVVTLACALVAGGGSGVASAGPVSAGQEETTTTDGPAPTEVPDTTATTEATTTSETTVTTEEPAATTATPTTAEAAPDADEEGDEDDDPDWALIGLIAGGAVLVLAIVWLVAAVAARRARAARARARHLGDLVSRAEWIHDEASLEVMAATASPDRLRTAWADTHRRMNDLAAEAAALANRDDYRDAAGQLRRLSHALGRLAGALDTHVSLHLQDMTDPAVTGALGASTETVTVRRDELRAALAPFTAPI